MNYPQGIKRNRSSKRKQSNNTINYANRGMSLESDINETNKYYLSMNKAIIHKKPTPIQVVKVHYPKRSAAKITEGYFQEKATTDYNGIYKGHYIDFEAKETKNKTTFPLANIHKHQIEHMKSIIEHDGICFIIVRFVFHNETYFMLSEKIISYWDKMLNGGKKSISYDTIQREGYKIPFTFQARVDYLSIIEKLYF